MDLQSYGNQTHDSKMNTNVAQCLQDVQVSNFSYNNSLAVGTNVACFKVFVPPSGLKGKYYTFNIILLFLNFFLRAAPLEITRTFLPEDA